MIQRSTTLFPLGYLLILVLKKGVENSDENLRQRTTAKMYRNKQSIWQSSGTGDTEVRDLRPDQKKMMVN